MVIYSPRLREIMKRLSESPTCYFFCIWPRPERTTNLAGRTWQNVSRHSANHVNLKSNTIMKKPRDKYKKEIKPLQIISIKNQKYFFLINL
jgi:hypothetical protein